MTSRLAPDDIYRSVHAAVGGRLFTVTMLDRAEGLAQRVYTSHPDVYPVSGTKPIQHSEWTKQVIDNGEVFVANTVEEFAKYFPDHALIQSLGCEAAMNIPIVEDQVVGTVNILDTAHYFDDQTVTSCISAVQKRQLQLIEAFSAATM